MEQSRRLTADSNAIDLAISLLRDGQCVALPSETVYGLAADARQGQAVARIFEAKDRPSFNPLITHVESLDQAQDLAQFSNVSICLARAFWPGPLTLVLPKLDGCNIHPLVTADGDNIALRCPSHPVFRAVLDGFQGVLAAPSANRSGAISPTTADHVESDLGDRIALILDGGPSSVGIESTIVTFRDDRLVILRPGSISIEQLQQVVPIVAYGNDSGPITAPGQLKRHYAPDKPMFLNLSSPKSDSFMIGFGPVDGDVSLSSAGDLIEAASRLYPCLHEANRAAAPIISVAPVPMEGLGRAINDRLIRAAAPGKQQL